MQFWHSKPGIPQRSCLKEETEENELNWNESVYCIIGSNFRSCHAFVQWCEMHECSMPHWILCVCVWGWWQPIANTKFHHPKVCTWDGHNCWRYFLCAIAVAPTYTYTHTHTVFYHLNCNSQLIWMQSYCAIHMYIKWHSLYRQWFLFQFNCFYRRNLTFWIDTQILEPNWMNADSVLKGLKTWGVCVFECVLVL